MLNDVTALIKTFIRDNYLFRCVSSLKKHYPDVHIIVADDGHTSDEKESKLIQLGVDMYIRLPFNRGLPYGRNLLLQNLETKYFLIGDDDFMYTQDSHLEYLLTMLEISDIAAGALSDGRQLATYEGLVEFSNNGARFKRDNRDFELYKGIRYKPCHIAYNFFMGKRSTVSVRWNEDLHILFEHADFFLEAYRHGHKVVFTPDAVALHRDTNLPTDPDYTTYRHTWADRQTFFQKWQFSYIDVLGRRYQP
jgi:GT2 family glycosyltransferase